MTLIEDRPRGHLVQRERAGFVGADHRRRAQGFHRRQSFDDGAIFCHAVHANGKRHRDHRRQSFGNSRHSQRNRGHDGLHQRVATPEAQRKDQAHHHPGDQGQPFAQRIELHLKRCRRFLRLGQQAGDAAHLGAHAGGADQQLQAAARDHGVHVGHVEALGQRVITRRQVLRMFAHRMRFAGQRSFGDFGVVGRQQPAVCGDTVAGLQQQHVARHQILRCNLQHLTVASHPRVLRQHFF